MGLNLSEYLDAFIQDAEDLLQDLDDNLLSLEKNPDNPDTINTLFRIAHTLKGNSGMMGFDHLKSYTHALESVMSLLRSGERQLDDDIFQTLFTAFGYLREAVQRLKTSGEENKADLIARTEWVNDFIDRGPSDTATTSGAESHPKAPSPSPAPHGAPHAVKGHEEFDLGDTIRVDVGKLDALLDSIGELVVNRTHTMELVEQFKGLAAARTPSNLQRLTEALHEQGRILSTVQETVMKARMIPVGYLFERCPRIARDVASKLGKKVQVEIEGAATELDKKMIDALSEPLLHLLNNAVDHGIEAPDVRRSLGKPEGGTIRINAYNEHNQVVLTIEDDGRGVDVDRLREKVADQMSEVGETDDISGLDMLDLLARPGFSLAKQVTVVSGRGVGLDVVRTRIEEVNGSLELESQPGHGTRFLIRLPLTIAIIQAVLVRYRGSTFAIPLDLVQEVVVSEDGMVRSVESQGTLLELRGELLPLIPLELALDFGQAPAERPSYLVIVGTPDKRIAIPVDELLGDQEVVMKTLNPLLGVSKFISGGSVLGDGEVVLILDAFSLFKL